MNRAALAAIALALLIPLQADAKQKLYKWVDKNGVTHYSARPPENQKAELISISTGTAVTKQEEPEARTDAEKKPTRKALTPPPPESKKDPEKCAQVRAQLEKLRNFPRIRVEGPSGEKRYLTPDEHQQRLKQAEKQEKEFCD
ncbi:DUF4124 domain-containing protein [Porticoccaceae bacterium LTM1]|nr:DUF4124 domain-containing protein [Porticoccaceae bacterium LTM1]